MKIFRKAAILILCVILVFSLSGCLVFPGIGERSSQDSGLDDSDFSKLEQLLREILEESDKEYPGISEEEAADEIKKPEKEESEKKGSEEKEVSEKTVVESASFMPGYYHYDKADFDALTEKLEQAAKNGDEKKLEETYEAAYQELLKLDDLYSSIYLTYSDDVSNTANDEEMNYTKSLVIDCEDEFCTVIHNILDEAQNDDFRNYLGAELTDYFLDYQEMDDTVKELYDRITDLETDYNAELNNIYSYSYGYNGREWTLKDLNDETLAEEFVKNDPRGYLDVYDGILRKFNEKVGPMYVELVDLYNQIARHYGYDNYTEYAYKEIYGRDYSIEDAAGFCDVVKQNVAPQYYTYVYYGGGFSTDIDYESSVDGLLSSLGQMTGEISSLAEESYKDFTEQKLYDLGYEEDRLDGAFTSYLSAKEIPFIFAKLGGGASDLITITHEFGHFTYFDQKDDYNYFLDDMSGLDLMEMHSNGFAALCTKYYDRFFGPQADDALHYALANILSNIVDGCVYDEFQRRVFSEDNPDLDRINEIYAEVASSYGAYSYGNENYEWCFVPHTFTSPFYYLSYAVSGLSALEIWELSQDDFGKGVEAWETLLKCTRDREGYFDTMEKCGLSTIKDSDKVTEICGTVLAKYGADEAFDLQRWLEELMR